MKSASIGARIERPPPFREPFPRRRSPPPLVILAAMKKLLLFAALASASAYAADITGTWEAQVDLDAGSGTATFTFKQSGEALTGTYSGTLGEANITGKLEGRHVEWSFEASQGGESAKIKYSGTLAPDGSISGDCDYGPIGKGNFKATKKTSSSQAGIAAPSRYSSRKLTSMVA